MPSSTDQLPAASSLISRHAPIKTWFGVGGCAARLARPTSPDQLRLLLAVEPSLRIVGDGANLVVDDDGVDGLVVSLDAPEFSRVEFDARTGLARVGAGVHLFPLINQTCKAGLGGLEVLAGIPATLGGALVMNAGGAFGQISDRVERVHALTRAGESVVLERAQIAFGYRSSGLNGLVITAAELALSPGDPEPLEARKKEIIEYKRSTQPMASNSAGCCFKNPILPHEIPGLGPRGVRISAGLLIDRAGLKGTTYKTASVSPLHGNFLVVENNATGRARDVIELIAIVQQRVFDAFGVSLETEVVIWSRRPITQAPGAGALA